MAGLNTVTIRMSVWLWNGVDGSMDNKATNARWEYWQGGGSIGDPEDPHVGPTSAFASAIREEGWRQVPEAGQLPLDDEIDVSLTREQWEFIVADARESLPVYEDLAQTTEGQSRQEMLDSAEHCRAIITDISRVLRTGGP